MEHVHGHRVKLQGGLASVAALRSWLGGTLLALVLMPGLAQAACGTMNVPDSFTTPSTTPMAAGGTITIDASRCDLFGLNPYPNPGTSPPSHGSLTVNTVQGEITYVNNGDGATSDSFVVEDASNIPFTVNVVIGGATSPISVSPGALPDTTAGVPYSQTLAATGGTPPYTWSIDSGSLPPLMSLSGATISGTTNTNGSFTFSVRVDDNAGNSAIKGYTINSPGPNIQITTNLPDPVRGIPYSQTMQAYPGTPPFTYDLDGTTLPAGLTLTPAGLLSGIPTGSGLTTFEIVAHDSSIDAGNGDNYFGLRTYTLTTLDPPPLTLSPAALSAAQIGVAYSVTISASGGVPPYSYAITAGALPAGLLWNATTGVISGTPTAGGSFNFDITATDSNSTGAVAGALSYSLTVSAPTITLTPATLPGGTNGMAYIQTISASGGTAPYSFAVSSGALPNGVLLSANGTLSGTPTVFGTFNFSVSAIDSSTGAGPYSQPQDYTLAIAAATPIANPVSATVAYGSGPNPISLNISGGVPTSVAVATAPTHGTALASGTTISYQPDAGYFGADNFAYTASNADGTSAPATVSITVTAPPLVVSVDVPADATYGTGDALDFSVHFSESVIVNTSGGAPYIDLYLDIGGTVQAQYLSGSGTDTLAFRYSVLRGNQDSDGVVLGTSIVFNGGTIENAAGTDALPDLNSVSSTSGVLVHTSVSILDLAVDDAREYARYGQMLDYVVTVRNSGEEPTNGVTVEGNYSAGLFLPAAQWQCFGGGSSSVPSLPHCTPSNGNGGLNAMLDLPVGASLTFLVSVPVENTAPGNDVTFGVDVTGGTDAADLTASDTDTLTLFRDGFDVPYADGTQRPGAGTADTTACTHAVLAHHDTFTFAVPPTASNELIDSLMTAQTADGSRIAVQRLNIVATPWLRLLTGDIDGQQHASVWASSSVGDALALGLADDGTRTWVLLEGTEPGLRLPLVSGAGNYTISNSACATH